MSAQSKLQSINRGDLGALLVASEWPREAVRFWGGRRIFAEGEPCAGVYVVRSGSVELLVTCAPGRAIRVSLAGPGDVIGLPSAMNKASYCKTAVAINEAVLDRFTAEDAVRFLTACPDRQMKAISFLCADADAMQRLLAEVKAAKRRVSKT